MEGLSVVAQEPNSVRSEPAPSAFRLCSLFSGLAVTNVCVHRNARCRQ